MLNPQSNTNANLLIDKDCEYVFSTLTNKTHKRAVMLYYEQKIYNLINYIYEEANPDLLEWFAPYSVTVRQIFFYKIYIEYLNKTYKFLRILYNLPIRKTRTHGLSNKKKWITLLSVSYCIKAAPIFRKLKLPKSKVQLLFFCEFMNSVWFFNWWVDWLSAYKNRIKLITKNPFIQWKYDSAGMQQGRAIFFTLKKKKTKHNRKKSTVLKNNFNIGFHYGFTSTYLKKVLGSLKKSC